MRICASDWTTDWQGLHIPGCVRPQWNLCVFVLLNEQLTDKVCMFQCVLDRRGTYAYFCFWMNNWLTRFAYSSVCLTAVESMRICVSERTTDWQGLHIPGCARPQWNLCVFVFLNEQLTDKVCIFQGVLDRSRIYAYLMLNYLAMWPASQPSPTAFAFMLTIEGQQASQCTHVDG